MSFDWTSFLTLAETLYQNSQDIGSEEACFRSAASRAYYAVFKIALQYAEDTLNYSSSTGGSMHRSLYMRYQGDDDQRIVELGMDLHRLYDNRVQADYKPELRQLPHRLAELSIETAHEIIERLSSISAQ